MHGVQDIQTCEDVKACPCIKKKDGTIFAFQKKCSVQPIDKQLIKTIIKDGTNMFRRVLNGHESCILCRKHMHILHNNRKGKLLTNEDQPQR